MDVLAILNVYFPARTMIAWSVVWLSTGCGGAVVAGGATTTGGVDPRPDIRGEPLSLLPADPVVWLRFDAATARESQHWTVIKGQLDAHLPLLGNTLERELGFDPLTTANMVALALYAPPGAGSAARSAEAHAWPVIYARGGVSAAVMLETARARLGNDDPLVQVTEGGYTIYRSRNRAYLALADDVVMIFDPALTRRIARVLDGVEHQSAAVDARFESLWRQVGGHHGELALAADLEAVRSFNVGTGQMQSSLEGLTTLVFDASFPSTVTVRAIGIGRDESTATRVEQTLDGMRQQGLSMLGGWPFSLSRLFQQGITVVHESTAVRLSIDVRADEVQRIVSAARLASVFGS